MKPIHTKSPCCKALVQRFGKRRRRCAECNITWRIRKKKRGRKRKRAHEYLALRFFERRLPSIRALAAEQGIKKDAAQRLLARSIDQYILKNTDEWRALIRTAPPLIAVIDAIWHYIQKEKYTIYVILLRPVDDNEAVIIPPAFYPGHESVVGWRHAFEALPKELESRIVAVVSDGATSIMCLVKKEKGWIIQRCHFHLIAAVQKYISTGPRSRHREQAIRVMTLVQSVLRTNQSDKLHVLFTELKELHNQSRSRGLRRVLRGFIADVDEYHAYLKYPELHLPTTSNAAESFIQCARDVMYRCRGFRSLRTLKRWLVGIAISKKKMACNGKNQPN